MKSCTVQHSSWVHLSAVHQPQCSVENVFGRIYIRIVDCERIVRAFLITIVSELWEHCARNSYRDCESSHQNPLSCLIAHKEAGRKAASLKISFSLTVDCICKVTCITIPACMWGSCVTKYKRTERGLHITCDLLLLWQMNKKCFFLFLLFAFCKNVLQFVGFWC